MSCHVIRQTEKAIPSPKPETSHKKEVVLSQSPVLSSTISSTSMEIDQPNIDLQISLSQRYECQTYHKFYPFFLHIWGDFPDFSLTKLLRYTIVVPSLTAFWSDLIYDFSPRWAGCNTLLIDVAAFWMIINETELNLAVIEDNEQTWKLPRKLAFAPPIFDVC